MRRVSLAFLTTCLLLLLVAAARAQDQAEAFEVREFTLRGVEAIDEGRLRAVLATRATGRLPWAPRRVFDREQFEADLRRIRAFYIDRGFPDARVTNFDIDLDADRRQVRLLVEVFEGDPVRVEKVRFIGFEVIPIARQEALIERIPLQAGEPRDRQFVQVTREMAIDELRDNGYPYAQVATAEQVGSGPQLRVVEYHADPGPVATFGPIEVTGHRSVDDEVIRRQLAYRPGDLFRFGAIRRSQRALYQLELFEFANVEPQLTAERPAEVPTRVVVTEGDHRRVTFGLGYGSEERARAEAQWRHVNFFGGARTAGVQGKWSSLERGFRFNFSEPYFFRPRLALGLTGHRWFLDEPWFRQHTIGGRAMVNQRMGRLHEAGLPTTTLSYSVIYDFQEFSVTPEALADLTFRDELIAMGIDVTTGIGEGTLVALDFDLRRSTVENILDARRGYVADLHLERAGRRAGGTYSYYELTGEFRHYFTLGDRAVVAHRIRIGSIDSPGELLADVPFFKRYFLGGSTSLRGWGRFQVSPLSGAGLPIGGHSMLEFTSEVRLPAWGNVGVVAFLDAGNVWHSPWTVRPGDLRYAAGPGLRYATPVGPLRFDLGYQLTPIERLLIDGEPEQRRWRIHLSIGQVF